tara:strand:- start:184 stop:390 length:207 start_codon:yes stop_codon:yes gene_type:complete
MYVARRESIKKNNKLSKVDWGITMSSRKNDISLKKQIPKKNQPFNYFFFKLINLFCLIKFLKFRLILI